MTGFLWMTAKVALAAIVAAFLWVDRPLFLFSESLAPAVRHFFEYVTFWGRSDPYLAAAILAFVIFRYVRFNPGIYGKALWLFLAVAVSGILANVVKVVVGRARPILLREDGFYGFDFFRVGYEYASFPSGHATTVFAVAAFLALLLPRAAWFCYALALLVAASRVALGAHYLSDIIAGAWIGVAVAFALREFLHRRGFDLRSR